MPIERIGTGVDHEIAECTEDGVARANGFVAVLEEDFNHGAKLIEARFAVVSEADGRDGFPRGRENVKYHFRTHRGFPFHVEIFHK